MTAFGEVLKDLRKSRRLSQLDLAMESDVSTRHISFLETGRSKPSREMILHLARMMDIPYKETNMLLASAGFSYQYQESPLNATTLSPIRAALNFMLDTHAPYPAIVMDENWNILMANQPQQTLTAKLVELGAKFPPTFNMMELFFDDNGYRPFVDNWEEVAIFLLQRIHKEHLLRPNRDAPNELLDKLLSYNAIPSDWQKREVGDIATPLVQLKLTVGSHKLSLFSTIATFGTPLDVTLQNIRIEHYFPGDDATKLFFKQLSSHDTATE
ncbi:helix-turn-helix domain-containing protein [Alkalimarinus coralli]|uniref:helix-turn-helix domain-containing protein n=1 Tax=Alkalimarinus coralli TaxID=2935863 RepID=UPI00202B1F10|nr:helix-turn-helix transcriptional regulator [Alkalimarinus coralli]